MASDRLHPGRTARRAGLVAGLLSASLAQAQFPVSESFNNGTAPGWTLLGGAVLTSGGIDPAGAGWLRLNGAAANQVGGAVLGTAFPSTDGIVVTFDYADWGGSGGDGFSLFLLDGATATPTIGASGGSLGYAGRYSNATCATGPLTVASPGVTNGWVGVGFDEYGTFSSCSAGVAGPGAAAQSVVIRGSGTRVAAGQAQTAFRWLKGVTFASVLAGTRIDQVPRNSSRQVQVAVVDRKVTVKAELGGVIRTLVDAFDLATATGQAAAPATFKLGLSASSGTSTNAHEIRNVLIQLPARLAVTQTASPAAPAGGGTVTYTLTVANDTTNAVAGASLAEAFPAGLTGVSWTAATAGGATVGRASGTGSLAETLTLPKGATVTYTVTATVPAAAIGQTLTSTATVTPPAGVYNLLGGTATTSFTVGKMATATALAANPSPAPSGANVTLTATVTPVAPASGTPGGTVTFLDGTTTLGSATLDASGKASFTTSALAVRTHSLTAAYGGAATWLASTSPAVALDVGQAATVTTLTASAATSTYGTSVTFTAVVAVVAPGSGTASGTVTFYDGTSSLGTGTLNGAGRATLATSAVEAGSRSITAVYGGASLLAGSSSAALPLTVAKATSSIAILAIPNSPVSGQAVALRANVLSAGATATGTVTFKEGTTVLGSAELNLGEAVLLGVRLPAGSHLITAEYGGDANHAGATSLELTLRVDPAATTTALTATPAAAVSGEPVALRATVAVAAPGTGTPTGQITFTEGATVLGTAALDASGTATLTTAALAVGPHDLVASFPAGAGLSASQSTAARVVVGRAATAVAVTATPSPAQSTDRVLLSATATTVAPGAGIPQGTVTFKDGAAELGTAALDATGQATLQVGPLAQGDHAITAGYGGDASHAAASGAVTLTVTEPAVTRVALSSSRNPSRRGRPVTFLAVVSGPGSAEAGTVTFKDGAAVLGTATLSGGQATFTTRELARGTHPVTAEYTPAGGAAATGTLADGQVVENSPPVALAGTALSLGGPSATGVAQEAVIDARGGALDTAVGTVELWARAGWTAAAEVGPAPTLASLGDGSTDRWRLGLAPDRSHAVVALGAAGAELAADLTDGRWHHLALVEDGARATLFLDGAVVGEVPAPFGDAVATSLALGRGFVGALDEVRVWSTARSAAELQASALRPLAGSEPGLVGLWRLDEGSGLELFDGSPSHLDGAIAAAGGAAPFAASTAWSSRTTTTGAPMDPVAAGYDLDGEPLTLTVTTPPEHGTASAAGGQLGYRSEAGHVGTDAIGFTLGDGTAEASATLAIVVDRIPACQVSADCGRSGDVCVSGLCRPKASVGVEAGPLGCAGGGGGLAALWSALGLLALGRRRAGRRER